MQKTYRGVYPRVTGVLFFFGNVVLDGAVGNFYVIVMSKKCIYLGI
jgi:hypothetical protein